MLETVAPGSFTTHPARINENAWRRSWIESDERDWQKLSPNGLAFSLEPFAMQAKTPARLKPSVGLTAGVPAGRRAWVEVSARGIICCETLEPEK